MASFGKLHLIESPLGWYSLNSIQFEIREYSSPLELLDHIIREKRADIFDLPIAEIAKHYSDILRQSSDLGLDMNLASEFIVMAASLMEIKTKMLLPESLTQGEDKNDPRSDLVLQLMAYRRMKNLAIDLEKRHEIFQGVVIRDPLEAKALGLTVDVISQDQLEVDEFYSAIGRVNNNNKERYNRQTIRIKQLLRREQWSVKDKMQEIWDKVKRKTRVFFNDLFPKKQAAKGERISAFLAVLEMAHNHELDVEQKENFGDILLEMKNGE